MVSENLSNTEYVEIDRKVIDFRMLREIQNSEVSTTTAKLLDLVFVLLFRKLVTGWVLMGALACRHIHTHKCANCVLVM